MTPHPQCQYWQKETILEQPVYDLQKYHCTRPHTPAAPAERLAIPNSKICDMCERQIRKSEREQVLDAFAKIIQQRYVGKYDNEAGDIPEVPVDELADIIQSLRGGGAP